MGVVVGLTTAPILTWNPLRCSRIFLCSFLRALRIPSASAYVATTAWSVQAKRWGVWRYGCSLFSHNVSPGFRFHRLFDH